ncbi:MAG: aminotransferase class V-fold PLP-dependent enzyme [Lachnospiraceae bacterium]|nr:aminotransferase class V-fold PLP-dependent enzyme [Lachnospiraceae bacterium]
MKKSLLNFLPEHAALDPVSFHMPGHKGSQLYRKLGYGEILDKLMDCDITEIPGADNLFQTEDVILEIMEKYKRLYGSKKSYLLVNGSYVGLIAGILSCTKRGDKVIMARNSHKSIFNAMRLGGLDPVYLFPEILEGHGILGGISPEEVKRLLDENPDAGCVVLPSPNYYGICSDIRAIAEACHERNKVLIVDQAHGAHLRFIGEGYPMSAEEGGADIVINSTHKTLASWTQTAVMNVMSDRVDLNVIEDNLQILESSSPSYPLMLSLDINADILLDEAKKEKLFGEWKEAVDMFYSAAGQIPGLKIIEDPMLDRTKLNMDMGDLGLTGNELEVLLNERGIFVELVTGNIIMGMTGIGTTKEHVERLVTALRDIASERRTEDCTGAKEQPGILTFKPERAPVPEEKESVLIDDCAGRVCAGSIIPYPPGIPLLCPGEVITKELIDYVKKLRSMGEKVIGVSSAGEILVGK